MRKILIIASLFICSCFAASAKVSPGGLDNALDISTSGIVAERIKAQVIAENIANIDTVKTDNGFPYRRKVVSIKQRENFKRSTKTAGKGVLNGVQVKSIKEDMSPFQKIYDPTHPEADQNGYVFYPNVDITKELLDLTEANGAFETNVVVFNTTKGMMQSSLEIGR